MPPNKWFLLGGEIKIILAKNQFKKGKTNSEKNVFFFFFKSPYLLLHHPPPEYRGRLASTTLRIIQTLRSEQQSKILKTFRVIVNCWFNKRESVKIRLVWWHINHCWLFNARFIFIHKTVLFETIQFSLNMQFSSIWSIDRTLIRSYHSEPEWTWEWWLWRGTPHSPKLQHYWNLTIRLFSVISRTLVGSRSYPSTEMQSVYSTAPSNWSKTVSIQHKHW